MNLRVLLVESDPEETLFLQEVLAEVQEGGYCATWTEIKCLHAPTWSDAQSVLVHESADVMLLSLDLEDIHGSEAFRKAQTLAPYVPVVLLSPEDDAEIAVRLVREGVQDFLPTSRVDCASLAHAMRNAIERQRGLTSLRSASLTDPLTGLLNGPGFSLFAERYRKLAERIECRLMVILAEPRNIAEISTVQGAQTQDLVVMEAAERMRGLAGPSDVLGRVSDTRFGLAIFDTPIESVEAAWSRIHLAAADSRIDIGAAIFDTDHPVALGALLEKASRDLSPLYEMAPRAAAFSSAFGQ